MITVREASERDADGILQVHVSSVRALCRDHYPQEQIEEWVGTKTPESYIAGMERGEAFVVAEDESTIVGFGVLANGEIRAVYVDPGHTGRKIGSLILEELENLAAAAGLESVRLNSTLNAVEFYQRAGYEGHSLTSHELSSGARLACVAMTKKLDPGCVG